MSQPGPLIIQSDHTIMLEVEHPQYTECRDFLTLFAELVKSPDFIHTYRVTPLSLWNAAALDITLEEISEELQKFAKYNIPSNVLVSLHEWHQAYGKLILEKANQGRLLLKVTESYILERIWHEKGLKPYWQERTAEGIFVSAAERGRVKHALVKAGYPVKDLCGYIEGDPIEKLALRTIDRNGNMFKLRDYQEEAVETFYRSGHATGGSGVIVLPCGSGKTIIGLGVMSRIKNHTLIVTTNNVSVHQWRDEMLAKTTIDPDDIGEFTGMSKNIKPITITTYQMLTYRRSKIDPLSNLDIFSEQNWGLIIYDEVHLLPAPVFQATIEIQAKRRLGLTATLVREDGKEDDVFALIGPKRYDVPWKVLESKGYIAEAFCTEYRIPLPRDEEVEYAYADKRKQFRIASENSRKLELVQELMANHKDDQILIIGQYISQLTKIAKDLKLPLITGKTKHPERQELYQQFKTGQLKTLIVSKVANFAVDLPDANVMIQISGTFGSRQEEAQRLGRLLRPKKRRSHFYTLVSKGTREQEFGVNRQLFLVEQGYKYKIKYFD